MTKQALLIFAKNPEAGKVKTRLAATIGNEAALSVYHQLLLHTVLITEGLPVDKIVFYSNYIKQGDMWSDALYYKEVQYGNDLGERMQNAFALTFSNGYESIVIIGTDCPDLSTEIITNAFGYLQLYDAIIGPAEDGGYYLLGMKAPHQLFDDIAWSTDSVFHLTISKCAALGLKYFLLPVLNDIDEEKDLHTFNWQKE